MGHSEKSKDWLFNKPITVHYDDDGNRTGHSEEGKDWTGGPVTNHYNSDGDRIGHSSAGKDFMDSPTTDHYDRDENRTGESSTGKDLMNSQTIDHRDSHGNRIGESSAGKDFMNNPITNDYGRLPYMPAPSKNRGSSGWAGSGSCVSGSLFSTPGVLKAIVGIVICIIAYSFFNTIKSLNRTASTEAVDAVFKQCDDEDDPNKSMDCYFSGLKKFPENTRGHRGLGFWLIKQKHLDGGIKELELALEIAPNDLVNVYSVAWTYAVYEETYPRAIDTYSRAIRINPSCLAAWYGLAEVQRNSKNVNASIVAIKKAIDLAPSNSNLYFFLASLLREKGEPLGAYHVYQAGFSKEPDTDAVYYCDYGDLCAELRLRIDTLKAYTQCLNRASTKLDSNRRAQVARYLGQ